MMSELTQAMIINGAVWVAVLHSDHGKGRKIGPVRILRPLVLAGAIVPLFIDSPATHGTGLLLELVGVVAGLLGGLAALRLMHVYRSPETGRPVSRTGLGYVALWTLVIGARAAFSYGASNWFPRQLGDWMTAHQASGASLTDGLIFMAVAMLLTRTIGMTARAAQARDESVAGRRVAVGS